MPRKIRSMTELVSRLSRLRFSLRRDVVDHRDILLLSFFNRGEYHFIGAQEPERIGVCSALLQDLQNGPSLTTGLQRLHLPTNTPGTL